MKLIDYPILADENIKTSLVLYLREKGYEAYELNTLWEGEVAEEKGDSAEDLK